MDISVELTDQPISCELPRTAGAPDIGAVVEFAGIVRCQEDGKDILGLEYEAYREMAIPVMKRILIDLAARHPCISARVVHRLGVISNGEAAIYVVVTAVHRGEAFALVTAFLDRLKQDVPIWKVRALPATQDERVIR